MATTVDSKVPNVQFKTLADKKKANDGRKQQEAKQAKLEAKMNAQRESYKAGLLSGSIAD